ncbi:MAG: hypothetical protein A2033_19485 [Bacteroidetes bacterium GWA2_31_9]|nr:MAG: hypothetical protein A2033_19485 [Bacteroidetes bacterium GWA2_31_9]
MSFISINIKYLRKQQGLTQEELARKAGIKRSLIGSYEEGRAVPKMPVLQKIAHIFNVNIDSLVSKDFSQPEQNDNAKTNSVLNKELRILSTVVNADNKELISIVPIKAAAGYANGYSDPEFIETLPVFSLPLMELSKERSYRLFQIKGDSMMPIPSGSYIICEFISDYKDINEGGAYILVTGKDGIVYKRIYNMVDKSGEFLLKSDSPEFSPFNISANEVLEIWKSLGFISFSLPDAENVSLQKLSFIVNDLKEQVEKINKKG